MEKEELEKKLTDLDVRYKKERETIRCEYAMANQNYALGDILKCDLGIILVDRIKIGSKEMFSDETEVVYCGVKLRRDLMQYKSGERESFYQSRVEQKLN